MLKAYYGFEIEDELKNLDEFDDGTCLRIIRTGWLGADVLYALVRFAIDNDFLSIKDITSLSNNDLLEVLRELDKIAD